MAAHGDRMTERNDGDVEAFLDAVTPVKRREDGYAVLALMTQLTGAAPVMWGKTIVGFGRQPYTTADGKEREWFAVGFSPRKQALTLYGLTYYGSHTEVLERLGPHTTGKGCLYLKRLDDVDQSVLAELIELSWAENHRPA